MNGLVVYAVRECCRGVYWGSWRCPYNPPKWLIVRVLHHATERPSLGPHAITGIINDELESLYGLFSAFRRLLNSPMQLSKQRYGELEIE